MSKRHLNKKVETVHIEEKDLCGIQDLIKFNFFEEKLLDLKIQ